MRKIYKTDFYPFRPKGKLIEGLFPDFIENNYAIYKNKQEDSFPPVKKGDLIILNNPKSGQNYIGRVTSFAYPWYWKRIKANSRDPDCPEFLKNFNPNHLREKGCRVSHYFIIQVEEWI